MVWYRVSSPMNVCSSSDLTLSPWRWFWFGWHPKPINSSVTLFKDASCHGATSVWMACIYNYKFVGCTHITSFRSTFAMHNLQSGYYGAAPPLILNTRHLQLQMVDTQRGLLQTAAVWLSYRVTCTCNTAHSTVLAVGIYYPSQQSLALWNSQTVDSRVLYYHTIYGMGGHDTHSRNTYTVPTRGCDNVKFVWGESARALHHTTSTCNPTIMSTPGLTLPTFSHHGPLTGCAPIQIRWVTKCSCL